MVAWVDGITTSDGGRLKELVGMELIYEISTSKEPDSGDLAKMKDMRIWEEVNRLMEKCLNSRFL